MLLKQSQIIVATQMKIQMKQKLKQTNLSKMLLMVLSHLLRLQGQTQNP